MLDKRRPGQLPALTRLKWHAQRLAPNRASWTVEGLDKDAIEVIRELLESPWRDTFEVLDRSPRTENPLDLSILIRDASGQSPVTLVSVEIREIQPGSHRITLEQKGNYRGAHLVFVEIQKALNAYLP